MTTILFLKIERDKHCFQIIETDELGQKFLSRETQNAMSSESVSETNDLSKKVERWRRRREEVLKYRYLQLYKAVYNLVEEILEPEVPKSPDELVAELEDRAFEGWTLKWERTQLTCRHVGKLSQRDLRKVFAVALPIGSSPSLPFLLKLASVYIRKRIDGSSTGPNGKYASVYEIMDLHHNKLFRFFDGSTAGFFRKRKNSLLAKDLDGNEIVRLVWTNPLLPFKRYLKVYCPPRVYIGSVDQKWATRRPEISVRDEEGKRHAIITMKGVQFPFFGPLSWISERTVQYRIDTLSLKSNGLIHGDWQEDLIEPVFGLIFPFEIGILHKIMLVAAGTWIFEDFFGKKLQDSEIPFEDTEDIEED